VPAHQRVDQILIHAAGRAQLELPAGVVEHIDRTGFGAGELHRLGDNGREHGFKIECRIDRLAHFAERAQLSDRATKLIGALVKFVEQTGILDGDDGLIGELLD